VEQQRQCAAKQDLMDAILLIDDNDDEFFDSFD